MMKFHYPFLLAFLLAPLFFVETVLADLDPPKNQNKQSISKIHPNWTQWQSEKRDGKLALYHFTIQSWPTDGRIKLPTPAPNITAAYWQAEGEHLPLYWIFDSDATEIIIEKNSEMPSDC